MRKSERESSGKKVERAITVAQRFWSKLNGLKCQGQFENGNDTLKRKKRKN